CGPSERPQGESRASLLHDYSEAAVCLPRSCPPQKPTYSTGPPLLQVRRTLKRQGWLARRASSCNDQCKMKSSWVIAFTPTPLTPSNRIESVPMVTSVSFPRSAMMTSVAKLAAVMPSAPISRRSWPPVGFASKPVITSLPKPAANTIVSLPAPPTSTSRPSSPLSESTPALPISVSAPPPPLSTLLPVPPVITLLTALPVPVK